MINNKVIINKIINSKKISGPYIISGPNGVGKNQLADYFIKKIIKEKKENLAVVQPEKNKEETKDREISIKTIREVMRFMSLKAPKNSFLVCKIMKAEKMNEESQNALLKITEENKKGKVFIFITESLDALLPTIRSRSFSIKQGLTNPRELYSELLKRDQENLDSLVYAWGKKEKLNKIITGKENKTDLHSYLNEIRNLIDNPIYEKLKLIEKMSKKPDIIEKIDIWIYYLTHVLEIKTTKKFAQLQSNVLKYNISIQKIVKLLDALLNIRNKIKYSNTSTRLLLEANFID